MWLAVATVVQYLILGVLAVAVLSLARQIGILHERTAPAALVRSNQGVQVGEIVPPTTIIPSSIAIINSIKLKPARFFTPLTCIITSYCC